MKRKSKDWLCLLSLNGNNISDMEVTVTHWFYMQNAWHLSIKFKVEKIINEAYFILADLVV